MELILCRVESRYNISRWIVASAMVAKFMGEIPLVMITTATIRNLCQYGLNNPRAGLSNCLWKLIKAFADFAFTNDLVLSTILGNDAAVLCFENFTKWSVLQLKTEPSQQPQRPMSSVSSS